MTEVIILIKLITLVEVVLVAVVLVILVVLTFLVVVVGSVVDMTRKEIVSMVGAETADGSTVANVINAGEGEITPGVRVVVARSGSVT